MNEIRRRPFDLRYGILSTAGLLFGSAAVIGSLTWLLGCQLPPVVKESVPPVASPSIGADLPGGGTKPSSGDLQPRVAADTPGLLRSNHKLHIVDQEMECDACHEIGGPRPSMPDHDTCSVCHEINLEEPGEDCLMCHVMEPGAAQAGAFEEIEVRRIPNDGGFQFDHTVVGDDPSVCTRCHTGAPESSMSSDNLRGNHADLFPVVRELGLSPENCTLCHTRMDKRTPPASHKSPDFRKIHGNMYEADPNLCMTCHAQDKCETCHRQTRPQSHYKPEWRRSHGKVGLFNEEKCLMCHSEQACRTCHNSEMPRDHTNFFRRRSHGSIASWNRDRCLVCHKQDYCESCHRGAAPRIPAQAFHNPSAPCLSCHSPSAPVRPLRRHGPLPEASCLNCHQF